MKNEKMYDGITGIRENIIERAEKYQFKKATPKRAWVKWGAMAACACLIIGIGIQFLNIDGVNDGAGTGGGGYESGTVFMSYTGPIFPLHSLIDANGIVAERNIDYDFSPYETRQKKYYNDIRKVESDNFFYNSESIVTDSYVLNNATDKDITLTMVYPFVANFREGYKYLPAISIDGNEKDTQLYAGKFAGYFYSAHGLNTDKTDKSNRHGQQEWIGYQTILEDGQYLEDALAAYPELNQSAIVYKLNDIAYDGSDENAINPTLNFEFDVDVENTIVLSYGSTGGRRNEETGEYQESYPIWQEGERELGDSYLIVLGKDISNPVIQGYRDGGCDEGEEITGVTADVERYETTLGEIVWKLLIEENEINIFEKEEGQRDIASDEMMFGSIAELMYDYGVLAEETAERYRWGALEDMWSETYTMGRVMYVAFDVTIPANSSVSVEASMIKDASFDHAGEGTDRNGYDLVTTLGSSLEFSGQTASISNTEAIEIVYQNFGFDLSNGITKVELDVNVPHYYIEIRKIKENGKEAWLD